MGYLDALSGGRALLGLGASDFVHENGVLAHIP